MKNEDLKNVKKSILGEFSALSGAVMLLVIVIVIVSISSFIFMNRVPPKKVVIEDEAEIFSGKELKLLEKAAEELKEEKDINVVIATTRDNPHGTADEDCKEYASEIYKDHCIPHPLQDNSGVCIYIDLTLDYPGGRFFWLYTYGSAFFAVSDRERVEFYIGLLEQAPREAQLEFYVNERAAIERLHRKVAIPAEMRDSVRIKLKDKLKLLQPQQGKFEPKVVSHNKAAAL